MIIFQKGEGGGGPRGEGGWGRGGGGRARGPDPAFRAIDRSHFLKKEKGGSKAQAPRAKKRPPLPGVKGPGPFYSRYTTLCLWAGLVEPLRTRGSKEKHLSSGHDYFLKGEGEATARAYDFISECFSQLAQARCTPQTEPLPSGRSERTSVRRSSSKS